MTDPLLIVLPGNDAFAAALTLAGAFELGSAEFRAFPDRESYVKIQSVVAGRSVAFVCTLSDPNANILPLLFAADAARDLGATHVGLIAPYLAYMRQDRRFESGEAITSRTFARILSTNFSWLVTVDPHLHRYKSLADIYSIPTRVLHASPLIADWIKHNIPNPVLIGPDAESEQWVSSVAASCAAPFTVLEKTRHGDRDVEVRVRDPLALADRTPVLVDDILSTAETMRAALRIVQGQTPQTPVCIAVHALFAEGAFARLQETGARIVTANTVSHATNDIDVVPLIASAVKDLTAGT